MSPNFYSVVFLMFIKHCYLLVSLKMKCSLTFMMVFLKGDFSYSEFEDSYVNSHGMNVFSALSLKWA